MKYLEIKLLPYDRILKVYFTDDHKYIENEYPKMENGYEYTDGTYFANFNIKGKFIDVIVINNQSQEWKKADWVGKACLIAHEVHHCIYYVSHAIPLECSESQAWLFDMVLAEIFRAYDWKKDCIKTTQKRKQIRRQYENRIESLERKIDDVEVWNGKKLVKDIAQTSTKNTTK